MDIHESNMAIHNHIIMDIHYWIMDIPNYEQFRTSMSIHIWIMGIHSWIIDIYV